MAKKDYPKPLYRQHEGNLQERISKTTDEESSLRRQGFKLLEELYPDPDKQENVNATY